MWFIFCMRCIYDGPPVALEGESTMSSLPQLIRTNVQLHGDRVATRFQGREQTWHTLQDRVARLAAGLHGLGIAEGDRIRIAKYGATLSHTQRVLGNLDKALALAEAAEKIKPWLEGKNLVKRIYVPGKLVSVVVK